MRKCSSCKHQVTDNYEACPYCGSFNLVQDDSLYESNMIEHGSLMQQIEESKKQNNQFYSSRPYDDDRGSMGWTLLGIIIPIVGIILYFVWKNSKPCTAKMAGIGGLLGCIINLILHYYYGV